MATEKQNDLKNQLANRAATVSDKPRKPEQVVGDYLKAMAPTLSQVLPKHLSGERFERIALNVIRTNPQLLQCAIPSLMGAVLESAKLGLEPGILGHAYLIPFRNNKENRMDVQFIIGYKGLIELTLRSGRVKNIFAYEVHENDSFEYELGTEQYIKHKPTMNEPGEVVAYYAVAELDNGSKLFQVMSKSRVEQHRDKFSKAKNFGPWKDNFDEMAKKTVIRSLIKYLPVSVEVAETVERDERVRKDITDDLGEYPVFDNETGEILNTEAVNE